MAISCWEGDNKSFQTHKNLPLVEPLGTHLGERQAVHLGFRAKFWRAALKRTGHPLTQGDQVEVGTKAPELLIIIISTGQPPGEKKNHLFGWDTGHVRGLLFPWAACFLLESINSPPKKKQDQTSNG